jgi:hypothetical protein
VTRQVVTEHDMWIAMYDYLIEQCNGYLKETYPESEDVIENITESLNDEVVRMHDDWMKMCLNNTVSTLVEALTSCMLSGCDEYVYHNFMMEVINLIWDLRTLTTEWLKANGTPVGFSVN